MDNGSYVSRCMEVFIDIVNGIEEAALNRMEQKALEQSIRESFPIGDGAYTRNCAAACLEVFEEILEEQGIEIDGEVFYGILDDVEAIFISYCEDNGISFTPDELSGEV